MIWLVDLASRLPSPKPPHRWLRTCSTRSSWEVTSLIWLPWRWKHPSQSIRLIAIINNNKFVFSRRAHVELMTHLSIRWFCSGECWNRWCFVIGTFLEIKFCWKSHFAQISGKCYLTYAIIGIFRLCATIASTWQLPSGPKIVATPSQIISVMARVDMTVSPRVSL